MVPLGATKPVRVQSTTAMFIRRMQLADIPQVSVIERDAFPPPWPATNFRRDLTVNLSTHYIVACAAHSDGEALPLNATRPPVGVPQTGSIVGSLRRIAARFLGGNSGPQPATDSILGFAGVWFLADEAHLSTIAVRSDLRWRGVGERLLCGVVDLALEYNAQLVTLEVRASNEAAQALYGDVLSKGYFGRGMFDPGGFARLIDIAACRTKGIMPLE